MLNRLTARRAALLVFIVSLLTIAGAWIFQWAGYSPCPLCLKQRWAYYAVVPLSLVLALAARPGTRTIIRAGLVLAGIIMLGSMVFGIYHAGVEWSWWPGPGTCEGTLSGGLPKLGNEPVVSSDAAALRILGLSLAGWNAVISCALAIVAFIGAKRG
jgi:disulfide bond formation protein DsbB